MKNNWLINLLLYMLGLCFNVGMLIAVVLLIQHYTAEGLKFGEDFAKAVTAEKESREITYVLEEETPAAEVAKELEELGIIGNQYLYRLELFLKGSSKTYKAGEYTLNQNMNNTEVNVTLRTPKVETVPDNIITIPEGYTLSDIATYLDDRALVKYDDFLEACATHEFSFSFLEGLPERPNRLEGYLFPDTYYISPEPTADEVIDKMLARFDEIFSDEYRSRAEELGWSIDQVVTMASVIEKEVNVSAERPKVSQVIYNRLNLNMALQMDCTVQYALNKPKERLLYSDLEVDSPYNTYLYPGLPVGPIANPGDDCFRAALFPEEGDWLYYVLMDEETGEHYFTDDFDDFNNAKARYIQ
ncbi:MAG: endolytic transglycosylase MltG [Clostridiales bacterium]|jgi:UPF0755 protein|nr:endolytic transglycosylase MltG [Clostridiales bacterium]